MSPVAYIALLLALDRRQVGCIVGGERAEPPQPDAAVVFVQKYDRTARVEGVKHDEQGYYTFLGLRYAEAPVGVRRFQRPTMRRLEGEVAATRPCAPCPQPHPARPGALLGHEDCLCLNIYSPKMPGNEKGSPVLFWVHGGGFRYGAASYYGGQHLAQKDTILVSVQYRLGSLGFLSNGGKDMSGNAGLFDLSAALQWVLDYIEYFGGDPSRVVTIGQGSGGTAASLLALSPLSRGGVRGVAALSGAPLSPGALEKSPEARARRLARHASCPHDPPAKMLACLRALPVDNIIKADSGVQAETLASAADGEGFLREAGGYAGPGAAVEGGEDERALPPLLQRAPAESVRRGEQARLPLLTGVVRDETARAVFGQYSAMLQTNLERVPDYVSKAIVGPLRALLPSLAPLQEVANAIPLSAGAGGGAAELLSLDGYYARLAQQTRQAVNLTQGLLKIAEATGDALFNFPAFLSVDRWSEAAPAFLYRFEYLGNKTRGSHFLTGLALVRGAGDAGASAADGFVGHGDELAYLFEPLDLEGKRLSAPPATSAGDDRVRDLFTSLLATFAHNLTLGEDKKQAFNNNQNQYFQIGSEIKVDENFRFCQMGLWGNIPSRLQTGACTMLERLTAPVQQLAAAGGQLTGALTDQMTPPGSNRGGDAISSLLNPLKPAAGAKPSRKKVLDLPFGFN